MCLPLIDGVFPALLVSGALNTVTDAIIIGATIFAGAGSLSIIIAHAETSAHHRTMLMTTAPILVSGAVLTALIAPMLQSVFHLPTIQLAAGTGLFIIAAEIHGKHLYGDYLIPTILFGAGMIAYQGTVSLQLTLTYLPETLLAVTVALFMIWAAGRLDTSRIRLETIRTGGAVVLVLIGLTMFGLPIPNTGIMLVFLGSVIHAYEN